MPGILPFALSRSSAALEDEATPQQLKDGPH